MSLVLTIVLGLLVFSVLVVFHEYGHFLAARRMGVKVERFSVGFGPVLRSKVVNGVEYAVSAFPLGGYVKMGGDDPRNREALKPGDFFLAAWWRRVIIALAGPAANFVFALVLSIALAWVGIRVPDAPNTVGEVTTDSYAAELGFLPGDVIDAVGETPVTSRGELLLAADAASDADAVIFHVTRAAGGGITVSVPSDRLEETLGALRFPLPAEVGGVSNGMPAYRAGLEVGDRITAVDGEPVRSWSDLTRLIHARPEQELTLTVQRGEASLPVTLTPQRGDIDGETVGLIGIRPPSTNTYTVRFGPVEGVVEGTRATFGAVGATYAGILDLVTGRVSPQQISGPVAIIEASGQAARAGVDQLLNLAIVLNVALMVFNLLPIPILDGGMVILSVWEGIRRGPVGEKALTVYQGIGLAVIGTLLIFVLIKDPWALVERQRAVDRISETAQ